MNTTPPISNQSEGNPGKNEGRNVEDDKNTSPPVIEPLINQAIQSQPPANPNPSTDQPVSLTVPVTISEQPQDMPQNPSPESNVSPEEEKLAGKRPRKSVSSVCESEQNDDAKDKSKVPGRWSTEEHKKYLEGIESDLTIIAIELYGKNWKKVEEYIHTRTGAQIRSHAQKYFNKVNRVPNKSPAAKPPADTPVLPPLPVSAPVSVPSILPTRAPVPNPFIPPSDPVFYERLCTHTEVVDSLMRIFQALKDLPEADPLADLKLTRGEELLNRILASIQKPSPPNAMDLHNKWMALIQKIKEVSEVINQISPMLERERYCKHLTEIMYDKSY